MPDPARRVVGQPGSPERRVVGYNRRTGEAMVRLEDGSIISVDGDAIPDWLAEAGFTQRQTRPGTVDAQGEPRVGPQDHPRTVYPAPPPMPISERGTRITGTPGGSVGFPGPGAEEAFLAEVISRGRAPEMPMRRPPRGRR